MVDIRISPGARLPLQIRESPRAQKPGGDAGKEEAGTMIHDSAEAIESLSSVKQRSSLIVAPSF